MYFECETWMGEVFLCKLNIFKAIVVLFFFNQNNGLIRCTHVPRKNIIFE